MPKFGATSESRLRTCDYKLQMLFREVVKYYDCTILQGHRDEETQNEYFRLKKSKLQWPNSKHNTNPSNAIDVAPYPIPENWGADHPKELVKFYMLAGIVQYQAAKMGLKIRFGGDWDSDGDFRDQKFDDLEHFELV